MTAVLTRAGGPWDNETFTAGGDSEMRKCIMTGELCNDPLCHTNCQTGLKSTFTYRSRSPAKKSVAQGKRDAKKARNKAKR